MRIIKFIPEHAKELVVENKLNVDYVHEWFVSYDKFKAERDNKLCIKHKVNQQVYLIIM